MDELNFFDDNSNRRAIEEEEDVDLYFDFLKNSYKYSSEDENGSFFPDDFPCEGFTSILSTSVNNDGDVVMGMYVMGDRMNWSFDPISGEFESRAFLPTSRRNHVAVKVLEYIWLFGGVDVESGEPVNDVDVYHIIFDFWITVPSSSLPYLLDDDGNEDEEVIEAFALSDTYIYVLTYNHITNTNKMMMIDTEKLLLKYRPSPSNDAENNTTEVVSYFSQDDTHEVKGDEIFIPRPSMATARDSGVTLLPFKSRFVFAVGGHADSSKNKEDHFTNNIVEVYDAKYNQWATLREKLNHGRINANLLLYHDIIYVFGGDHETTSTSSLMEAYDPRSGKNGPWNRVRSSFFSSYSSWDFTTLVASYQLQSWYFLASKKVVVPDSQSGSITNPSSLCERELYAFHPPYKKVSSKWTKTKFAIQDKLEESYLVQRFRSSGKIDIESLLWSVVVVASVIALSIFLHRRFRERHRERIISSSLAEFEMQVPRNNQDSTPDFV